MSHVALTGANGFLGWHTRCAALAAGLDSVSVAVGDGFDAADAATAISGSSRLLHIAGVNRASDDEVRDGNLLFATQVASALEAASSPPPVVVFANSTQVGNGSVYGKAKQEASAILERAAVAVGAEYVDLSFPNLFGEHGRPFYNSVVSTFCHLVATGGSPTIDVDKRLTLMHAQDAADLLLGSAASPVEREVTVTGLLELIEGIEAVYRMGEIPSLATRFDRDLFNTYRSYVFPTRPAIELSPRADDRGSLVEIVRSHGGSGQFAVSTTAPGHSRANHFHRRKIERFSVIQGTAVISMRRLMTEEVVTVTATAQHPVSVDVPTLWTHSIANGGDDDLHLAFWSNELFDPAQPDTVVHPVVTAP